MELEDFLLQVRMDVKEQIADRISTPGSSYPYEEMVFTEIVMDHMANIEMTFDVEPCHYERTIGNTKLRLGGYAVSADADQLDLFVSLYEGVETVTPISDKETKTAAEQCLRFLKKCAEGHLARTMDQADDAYRVAHTIHESYQSLDQIRIYVLTDRQAKTKNFQPREIQGKLIKLEIMDIERLWRHCAAGKPRDELVVNFEEVCGSALPCVYMNGNEVDYNYALTAIPGDALRFIYEKYGARLLEANVRSFLSVAGKVNRGIRDTLRKNPERFMAYNNGIVLVTDELRLGRTKDNSPGIVYLKGMQIVNGGQTLASIYFTKRKNPEIDLSCVRVSAKIIELRSTNPIEEEGLISDISRYANSQNSVKLSDLSANKPFHVRIEQLSLTTYCADGSGRWFYERAAGSYNTMLALEGTTLAKLRKLKADIPASRKITKTDLAKFLNAWNCKPHVVSFGAQKNFDRFMEDVAGSEGQETQLPDVATYKRMIAKAIIFKKTQQIVRPLFPAFQANIVVYTVSTLSERVGHRIDLDKIWIQQSISLRLQEQIQIWAREVNNVLHASAAGRMISEWAKKVECWDAVRKAHLSALFSGIPEIR